MDLDKHLFNPWLWGTGLALSFIIGMFGVFMGYAFTAMIAGIGMGTAAAGLVNCQFYSPNQYH